MRICGYTKHVPARGTGSSCKTRNMDMIKSLQFQIVAGVVPRHSTPIGSADAADEVISICSRQIRLVTNISLATSR